ncbi:MAG: OmpA family protein [Notoacmeibacter sp.]|nr:OmpA family protein [Notoacmeibacter sp.]
MCDWRRWIWPGIIATALLTVLAMMFRSGPIEQDLTARVGEAQSVAGWAKTVFDGRDATVTGTAPGEEARDAALQQARQAYGVRVVRDASDLSPLANPYVFSAVKDAGGVKLAGNFPAAPAGKAIADAAASSFPGIAVTNAMSAARGAPAAWEEATGFAMTQLAGLTTGTASVTGDTLSVKGVAADEASYEAVTAALAGVLPAALKRGDIAIEAPAATGDYLWSATKDGSSVVLEGFVPSAEDRNAIAARAAELNPGATIDNRLKIASGAPAGFMAWTGYALGTLAKLQGGKAGLVNTGLTVAGIAADPDTRDTVRASLQSLPEGLKLASADISSGTPDWGWTAGTDGSKLVLSGIVPDRETGDRLVTRAGRMVGPSNVTDQQTVGKGAPDGFEKAALAAMQALSRMADGTAKLTRGLATLTGTALTGAGLPELKAGFAKGLPSGFTADDQVTAAAGPGAALDASACQSALDALSAANTIYFDTGSAGLDADSRGMVDRLARVTAHCEAGAIEVGGHTDSDGDEAANQLLSEKRAGTVLEALVAAGTPRDVLKATGYGETAPVADNGTAEGKAKNRRIVFKVISREELARMAEAAAKPAVEPVEKPAEPAAPACIADTAALLAEQSINFKTGKAIIDWDSFGVLDRISAVVAQCPAIKLEVAGHTDSDGGDQSNMALSARRADVVMKYLVSKGVDAGRLTAQGYGESRPLVPNDSPENKAKNRRIEITVKQ